MRTGGRESSGYQGEESSGKKEQQKLWDWYVLECQFKEQQRDHCGWSEVGKGVSGRRGATELAADGPQSHWGTLGLTLIEMGSYGRVVSSRMTWSTIVPWLHIVDQSGCCDENKLEEPRFTVRKPVPRLLYQSKEETIVVETRDVALEVGIFWWLSQQDLQHIRSMR